MYACRTAVKGAERGREGWGSLCTQAILKALAKSLVQKLSSFYTCSWDTVPSSFVYVLSMSNKIIQF